MENVRRRCYEMAVNGKLRSGSPVPKLVIGEQEPRLIALPLSLPQGYGNSPLRLLAQQVAELEIVDSISHETAGRTLNKTGSRVAGLSIG